MKVIVDTDALLGIFNLDDPHHENAIKISAYLKRRGASIFIVPTTIAEFALLASSRIGVPTTRKATHHLIHSDFLTLDVTEDLTFKAEELYQKQTSKEESLFDCYVMVAAKKIPADYIFSFDKGYEKNGFALAKDLLEENN